MVVRHVFGSWRPRCEGFETRFLRGEYITLTPTPHPGGPWYLILSGTSLKTWPVLQAARLPPPFILTTCVTV